MDCLVEDGWKCLQDDKISKCMTVCGDSKVRGNEECDDGNTFNSDGCSKDCIIELGFNCDQ